MLQGIPCLYYGTEQRLLGAGDRPEVVREALWGRAAPNGAFDREHPFYLAIQTILRVRREQPALRYGRQYFRPISGNNTHFGISAFRGGVLAFSRIFNDQEILVIANASAQFGFDGSILVDFALHRPKAPGHLLYSNKLGVREVGAIREYPTGGVEVMEAHSLSRGLIRVLDAVRLEPMEVQIVAF